MMIDVRLIQDRCELSTSDLRWDRRLRNVHLRGIIDLWISIRPKHQRCLHLTSLLARPKSQNIDLSRRAGNHLNFHDRLQTCNRANAEQAELICSKCLFHKRHDDVSIWDLSSFSNHMTFLRSARTVLIECSECQGIIRVKDEMPAQLVLTEPTTDSIYQELSQLKLIVVIFKIGKMKDGGNNQCGWLKDLEHWWILMRAGSDRQQLMLPWSVSARRRGRHAWLLVGLHAWRHLWIVGVSGLHFWTLILIGSWSKILKDKNDKNWIALFLRCDQILRSGFCNISIFKIGFSGEGIPAFVIDLLWLSKIGLL